jgi:hypothetical protein
MFAVTSLQFVGQNFHFAIYLFAALACFAAGWLYYDAWTNRRTRIDLPKWTGFFLLAVGFLIQGAVWESGWLDAIGNGLKLLGYLGLLVGNILEPIQPRPKFDLIAESEKPAAHPHVPVHSIVTTTVIKPPAPKPSAAPPAPSHPAPPSPVAHRAPDPLTAPAKGPAPNPAHVALTPDQLLPHAPIQLDAPPRPTRGQPVSGHTPQSSAKPTEPASGPTQPEPAKPTPSKSASALLLAPAQGLAFALPIAALAIAALYWRRATTGLERHLKPIAGVFAAMTLADTFALAKIWRANDNPLIQQFTSQLGPLWFAEHIALLVAAIMLVWWVWHYLTKRFLTQFFLTMTTFTVTIVLVATVSITTLLLSSLQKDSLASLETAAKVLNYAINAKSSETRANATVLAQTPAVVTAAATGDHTTAAKQATDMLVKQHLSDVIVTSDTGQVLARASDPDRYGDSISDDTLVKRALVGTTATTTTPRSGVLSPELVITTAAPIRQTNRIVGVSLASISLDNSFVDGIKHTTGLDSAVYAGDTRSATTLVGPDGTSRSTGVKETSSKVKDTTLTRGGIWRGPLTVSNINYLAIYLPLKDVDNTVVGMLFVGQIQDTVLQSASQAIKLTFGLAVLWLLIIVMPIYLISRYIARQLR